MNIYEAEKFMKSAFPGKAVTYEFDNNCLLRTTYYFREGKLNSDCMVFYNKALFHIEGEDDRYLDIQPHAEGNDPKATLEKHRQLDVLVPSPTPNL